MDWLHLMSPALEPVLCPYCQFNTNQGFPREIFPDAYHCRTCDILFHELSSECSWYSCVEEVGLLILWFCNCNFIPQCLCCISAHEETTARGRKRRSFTMPQHLCSSSVSSMLFSPDSVSLPLVSLFISPPLQLFCLLIFYFFLSHLHTVIQFFEGSRPDHTQSWLYAACALSYLGAMVSSNSALQYVNYPTQVSAHITFFLSLFPPLV